eukprot:scaffold91799_cov63-Phaeocystis_antarctica.AAC.6
MATRPHPRLSTAHLCTARVPRATPLRRAPAQQQLVALWQVPRARLRAKQFRVSVTLTLTSGSGASRPAACLPLSLIS